MKPLKEFAGAEWEYLYQDAEKMAALVALRSADEAMRTGRIPEGYTKTVQCENCGTVKLWPECTDEVIGCPWCHIKNKPKF